MSQTRISQIDTNRVRNTPGAAGARRAATGGSAKDPRRTKVAVIVPTFNGKHHLEACLDSLCAQRTRAGEVDIYVVDNGSVDGSRQYVRDTFQRVKLLTSPRNLGFAAACNFAAQRCTGADYLVFVNNDMRVEEGWLASLLEPLWEGRADATTSKILAWEGDVVDFAGGGMNFHGIGIPRGHGEPPGPQHDEPAESLFACGGSMAIRSAAYRDVGGFDDDFFAYYEDVDLGWRMWILGYRILYVPSSVAYHHLSATSRTFGFERIRLLQIRNPLLSIFKNYDDRALARVLPVALLLTVQRTLYLARLPDQAFRIEDSPIRGGRSKFHDFMRRAREGLEDRMPVSKVALADLIALKDFAQMLPETLRKREIVQRRRKRPDREVFHLFFDPLWAVEPPQEYAELQRLLTEYFGITSLFNGST